MAKHNVAVLQWYDSSMLHIKDLVTGHESKMMPPFNEALDGVTLLGSGELVLTCDNNLSFRSTGDGLGARLPNLDSSSSMPLTRDRDYYYTDTGPIFKLYSATTHAEAYSINMGDWVAAHPHADNLNGFATFTNPPPVVFNGFLCQVGPSSADNRPLLHRINLSNGDYSSLELTGMPTSTKLYVRNVGGVDKLFVIAEGVTLSPFATPVSHKFASIAPDFTVTLVDTPDSMIHTTEMSVTLDPNQNDHADKAYGYVVLAAINDSANVMVLLNLADGTLSAVKDYTDWPSLAGLPVGISVDNTYPKKTFLNGKFILTVESARGAGGLLLGKAYILVVDILTGVVEYAGRFSTQNRDAGDLNVNADYTSLSRVVMGTLDAYKVESTVKGSGNVGLAAEVTLIDDLSGEICGRTTCDAGGNYYFRCWSNTPKTVIATHPTTGVRKGSSGIIPTLVA